MPRALMLTGDAAEELDAMYPLYRIREAGWDVDVAALSRRDIQLVIHDFDPNSDAYTEKNGRKLPGRPGLLRGRSRAVPGAGDPRWPRSRVHPHRPGRAPHHRVLLRAQPARGPDLPRSPGARGLRIAQGPSYGGIPASDGRHGECRRHGGGRAGRRRRQHRVLPRLARHAGVLPRLHGAARAGPPSRLEHHRRRSLRRRHERSLRTVLRGGSVRRRRIARLGTRPGIRPARAAAARIRTGHDGRIGLADRGARAGGPAPSGRPRPGGLRRDTGPRGMRSRLEMWTAQAAGLMDALGIERYAVMGHSMGAAVALSLAASRPDAVTRVVGVGAMGAQMPLPPALDALWAARPGRDDARDLLRLLFFDPALVTEAAVDARYDAMLAGEPDSPRCFPLHASAGSATSASPRNSSPGSRPRYFWCTARRTGSRRCATPPCRCSSSCPTYGCTSSAAADTCPRSSTRRSSTGWWPPSSRATTGKAERTVGPRGQDVRRAVRRRRPRLRRGRRHARPEPQDRVHGRAPRERRAAGTPTSPSASSPGSCGSDGRAWATPPCESCLHLRPSRR